MSTSSSHSPISASQRRNPRLALCGGGRAPFERRGATRSPRNDAGSPDSRHGLADQARGDLVDELLGVEIEDIDSALTPRLALDAIRPRRDCPRAIDDAFASP